MAKCIVCSKEAYFNCSKCQKAFYCSKDHQIEDWKDSHKKICFKGKVENDELLQSLLKKRYFTRKHFYDNYSSSSFEQCLIDAKVMVDFDKKIKTISSDSYDEFQYAASVCALCRSYYLIKDKSNARMIIQNYLTESDVFLNNLNDAPDLNGNVSSREKEVFQRKMNLLSTIANLCYALELDCIKYYVLYTKHIERAFGKSSFEASNCYFLIGCYFSEEGFFKKAIACFMKSAACRGSLAGDCYFNIGVLYTLQKKFSKALEMFGISFKLRHEQYGQDSGQLIEVKENMGIIYMQLNDFITAHEQFDIALKFRQMAPHTPQQHNVIDLIHQNLAKLKQYTQSPDIDVKKPSIFLSLIEKIQNDPKYWRDREKKQKESMEKIDESLSFHKAKNASEIVPLTEQERIQKEQIMLISQSLMEKLNSTQLFMLSDLQLELSTSPSQFAKVFMIGKSMFLQKLTPENMAILRADNPVLFQRIRIEELEKLEKKV